MIFNNIDFEEFLIVERINRNLLPPIEGDGVVIPGRPGRLSVPPTIGSGTISVDIRIIEDDLLTVQQVARKVAGLLFTTQPKVLKLRDEPGRYNYAMISGEIELQKVPISKVVGSSTLIFRCDDPLTYDENMKNESDISGKVLENKGTAKTKKAVISLDVLSTVSFVKITLKETLDHVQINQNLVSGDRVLIDLDREVVSVNDILVPVTLDSDFFEIPSGKFTINSNTGAMAITYKEAWY